MPLGWVSMRWTASNRSIVALLLVSALAISLTYFRPYPFRTPPSRVLLVPNPLFEIDFDFTPPSQLLQAPEPENTQPPNRPLGEHTLTPNGLLIVNPDAPHPIFQLIRDAEAAWEEKLARASKTLDEAVAEYKRRYRRAPPLGFDKWWNYVITHQVQLPDEYDEIFHDIEPFWGIDPTEFVHMQEEVEKRKKVTIVQKTEGQEIQVVEESLPEERKHLLSGVKHMIALLREVEQDIPPFRITISPFDNPSLFSDWQMRTAALEAAANGTTLMRADLPTVTEAGWIQGCSPDSPARLHPPPFSSLPTTPPFPPPAPKSFIVSHRDAMDPCLHPSLLTTHSQFLSHKSGPLPERTLVPLFSYCSTLLHHDIRPPVTYGWNFETDADQRAPVGPGEDGAFKGDLPWELKVDERLGWRGRTTGMWASPITLWVNGHRPRLVTLTTALEGNVSVLRVPKKGANGEEEAIPVGEPEMVRLARVNPAWMDIAFTEGPIACDANQGTCDEMHSFWEFRKVQDRHEEGRYKFILDVDGNGWSGRFKRLMTTNALIFKATVYPDWYTSRIAPWVHYIPIQMSYSDLYDAVAFFRVHDELAARIATAGRDWSRQFWRREDLAAYLYRLLLEYARVSSLDRASMDYVG